MILGRLFSFDGVEHGGILAAYIGSPPETTVMRNQSPNAQDIFSQVSASSAFCRAVSKFSVSCGTLSAYVDITLFRAEYISRNEHAFYDAQGRFFQQHPVLKGAGLSFVRIAYNILYPLRSCISFSISARQG